MEAVRESSYNGRQEDGRHERVDHGVLFCLAAGVAWGASFSIAGAMLTLIDPLWVTSLRYSAVSLILVGLHRRRLPRRVAGRNERLSTLRWEMGYMIAVSGVLAQLAWNAGNRALTPINGILFITAVPVTTFAIALASGHGMAPAEVAGAVLAVAALVANNVHQRRIGRGGGPAGTGITAADALANQDDVAGPASMIAGIVLATRAIVRRRRSLTVPDAVIR